MQRALPWILCVCIAAVWVTREFSRPADEPTTTSEAAPPRSDGVPAPGRSVVLLETPEIPPGEISPEEEVEEPVFAETVKDHNETVDNETDANAEWEEAKGKTDALSDKPFDGTKTNDAIGLGGGAGSAFGGRRIKGRAIVTSGGAFRRESAPPAGARPSRPITRPPVARPSPGTETYHPIREVGFRRASAHPLSTFSVDVDTASYANVRRFIESGVLPPADAVRIEELLNWFSYDLPEPEGDDAFSRTVELSDCPWNEQNRLVRIALKGKRPAEGGRKPSNLVFLLDVSGSMGDDDKLPLLKVCLKDLATRLREDDRVSIVTYASTAQVALPSARGNQTATLNRAIDTLTSGGSTNGEGGIHLAYELARKHFIKSGVNRVILATDGDFNVGVSDRAELIRIIKAKAKTGVYLSCLGFGTGNYRDDVMEGLADNGNGHYAYIDSLTEGRKVLGKQLQANLETIAKDVKIQVEFNPTRVLRWRLVGYENRALAARDFNDDKKDAGEIGAGHSVTALYEVSIPGGAAAGPGVDKLRYRPRPAPKGEFADELLTLKIRYKRPDGDESTRLVSHVKGSPVSLSDASKDMRFAAAVALFGMTLRHSPNRGAGDLGTAMELAAGAVGDDPEGQRAGFVDLVRKARAMSSTN